KRHLKCARQLGLHPLELVDPDPALMQAIEVIVNAEKHAVAVLAAGTSQREAPTLPDSSDTMALGRLVADEADAVEAPWLVADFDFGGAVLEARFKDALTPEAIADAAMRIAALAAE